MSARRAAGERGAWNDDRSGAGVLMHAADYGRLVLLAAIWGASFLFMRIAAPEVGPSLTTAGRLLIAGAALVAWTLATGGRMRWRERWKNYLLIGALNAAVPFYLFAFAAIHLPASLSALLNATAPMFGALCGAIWLGERLTPGKLLGLAAGMAGVAALSRVETGDGGALQAWAILACLLASLCYGVGGVVLARFTARVGTDGVSAGAMVLSGLALFPLLAIHPPLAAPSTGAALSIAGLGLLCTAFAYWLYVRLIADLGATRALAVTYLIPLFGLLWAMLFLGEALPPGALLGGALVVTGTVLVVSA